MHCESSSLSARIPQGRSIKAMRQAPTLRSRQWDTCPFESGRPCQTFQTPGGVCKRLKRAVLQTVARVALRVRTPPPLSGRLTLAVAQPAERCTVNAVRCGFESRRPTFHSTRGVSQARSKARDSLSRSRGFESRTPCQTLRNCGREVRHSLVERNDDGSSPSSSAFSLAPEAQQARAPAS